MEILNAGEGWSPLSQGTTDDDGRIKQFVLRETQLGPGTYRLVLTVDGKELSQTVRVEADPNTRANLLAEEGRQIDEDD